MLDGVRELVPAEARQRMLWEYRLRRLFVGSGSRRDYHRLRNGAPGGGGPPVTLRVRALDGRPVTVRPDSTDMDTLVDTFWWGYHVPPEVSEVLDRG